MPITYKKRSRLKGGVTIGLTDDDMFFSGDDDDDDGSFHSATSSQPPSPEPSLEQDRAIEFLAAMRTPAVAVNNDDDDDERQRLLDRAERERAAASTIDRSYYYPFAPTWVSDGSNYI